MLVGCCWRVLYTALLLRGLASAGGATMLSMRAWYSEGLICVIFEAADAPAGC
jgi:hypothetical protein